MYPLLPNVHGELIQNKPSNLSIFLINISGDPILIGKGEKLILSYYTDNESNGEITKPDALAKSKLDFIMEVKTEGLDKEIHNDQFIFEPEEVTSSVGVESKSYIVQNDFTLEENKSVHIRIKDFNTTISPRIGNFYLSRKKGLKTFFRIPVQVTVKSEDVQINGQLTVNKTIYSNNLAITGDFNSQKDLTISDNKTLMMPIGTILLWNGTKNTVPHGWGICDGTKYLDGKPYQEGIEIKDDTRVIATPNLSGRFIVGIGSSDSTEPDKHTYAHDEKGGFEKHKLTKGEMPSHNHSGITSTDGKHKHEYTRYNGWAEAGGKYWKSIVRSTSTFTDYTEDGGKHSHSIEREGSDKPHENRPPYYALYYIMRIK